MGWTWELTQIPVDQLRALIQKKVRELGKEEDIIKRSIQICLMDDYKIIDWEVHPYKGK